jgi:hypothetical protein
VTTFAGDEKPVTIKEEEEQEIEEENSRESRG